jgi:GNAT superfamily N-acetyltransferase
VIDAELPRTHPDPELRGKGLYRALLDAALPRFAPTAHVVAHNILLADATGDAVLAEAAARNAGELGPFRALAARELDGFAELASTEGVGVGVRAR